jgi:hemolysin E
MTDVKTAITIAKDAMDAGEKALDLYNKVVDQVIPWKTFEKTVTELGKYEKDYSASAGALVGQVKTLVLDAQDKYLAATQSVFEWAGICSGLLVHYVNLFDGLNEEKAKAQRTILLKVLDDGVTKMGAAQLSLQASTLSFNGASGKLITLSTQLRADFDEGSVYFQAQVDKLRKEAYAGAAVGVIGGPLGLLIAYSIAAGVLEGQLIPQLRKGFAHVESVYAEMTKLIVQSGKDIDAAKAKLQQEIRRIGEMKGQAEETKLFVELDALMIASLKESATKLINACNQYRAIHSTGSLLAA